MKKTYEYVHFGEKNQKYRKARLRRSNNLCKPNLPISRGETTLNSNLKLASVHTVQIICPNIPSNAKMVEKNLFLNLKKKSNWLRLFMHLGYTV